MTRKDRQLLVLIRLSARCPTGPAEAAACPPTRGTWARGTERRFVAGVLALDAGYRRIRGRVGIPGHREARAEPVLFTDGEPEVKVFFSLGL